MVLHNYNMSTYLHRGEDFRPAWATEKGSQAGLCLTVSCFLKSTNYSNKIVINSHKLN